MKVLVLDGVSSACVPLFNDAGIDVDIPEHNPDADTLMSIIPAYHGLLVRSATKVTAALLKTATNLRVIGRAGAGVDNIDLTAAAKAGVIVVNAPDGNTLAAAEHTFALMLALARQLPRAHHSLQNGGWERKRFMGTELFGKTIAVIGLGRIGTEVARRATAFGMKVLVCDTSSEARKKAAELGICLEPLREAVSKADFVTLHLPLTNETTNLIDATIIAAMKPSAYIINAARGGIVDESALFHALQSGKLAGAALDVFSQEPPANPALCQLPNVVVTPHLGASTVEAQERVALDAASDVIAVLTGNAPKNRVA